MIFKKKEKKYTLSDMSKEDIRQFQVNHHIAANGHIDFHTMSRLLEEGIVEKGSKEYKDWLRANGCMCYDDGKDNYPYRLL